MAENLEKTLIDAFLADTDLSTSCPGGCVAGRSDPGTSKPYAVLVQQGAEIMRGTGDTYVSQAEYDFQVYGETRHAVYQACQDLLDVFDKDQDNTALSDGELRESHRQGDPVITQLESEPPTHLGVVSYVFIVQRSLQSAS